MGLFDQNEQNDYYLSNFFQFISVYCMGLGIRKNLPPLESSAGKHQHVLILIFSVTHVCQICVLIECQVHIWLMKYGLSFKFHFATTTFKKLLFLPFYTHNILSTFYLWSRIFIHDSVPLRQEFIEDSVIFSTYFYPLWCLAWSLRHDKCTIDSYWNESKYFLLV